MHGDPAAGAHTHGADLSGERGVGIKPYSGLTFASACLDSVFRESEDHHLFEQSQVLMDIGKEILKVEDGVTHDLSRAVIGDVPAPVYFIEAGILLLQLRLIDKQV